MERKVQNLRAYVILNASWSLILYSHLSYLTICHKKFWTKNVSEMIKIGVKNFSVNIIYNFVKEALSHCEIL